MNRTKLLLLFCLILCPLSPRAQSRTEAREQLGKALEYFQSAKYQEAQIILESLDSLYRLNPRYKAYLGVCHYYNWQYEDAIKYIVPSLPELKDFSPQELSFYNYAVGESYFNLGQYQQAIQYYETMLTLCKQSERADGLYRLGFCHLFLNDKETARECFQSSLLYYRRFLNDQSHKARITQIENMVRGLADNN